MDENTNPNETPQPPVSEELVICLDRREIPIKLKDVHGIVKTYTLREMAGVQRDKWLNSMGSRLRTDKNGNVLGVRVFDNLQASLIAKCLYDDRGELVPEEVIAKWPSSAQKILFQKCQEMNALTDEGEEAAKKD